MLVYDDYSKDSHVIVKKFIFASFKSTNSSPLYKKSYDWGNFTPTPVGYYEVKKICRWEKSEWNLLSLLIHWITSHFLNFAFYKLFYAYFSCLCLYATKSFFLKAERALYFFDLVWGGSRCYSFKKSVFLMLFL